MKISTGERYKIISFENEEVKCQFEEMGILSGSTIEILKKGILGGPYLIGANDNFFFIRRENFRAIRLT